MEYELYSNSQVSLVETFHEYKERFLKQNDLRFNLLEQINPNENAISRILGRFFQIQHEGNHIILQSFVNEFLKGTFKGEIKRPEVYNEYYRTDILVCEPSYAIIFENKIWKAPQQRNQLARYITALREEGYLDEQIYVIYLSPSADFKPFRCNWMVESENCKICIDNANCLISENENDLFNLFEQRYRNLSFSTNILPWLKDKVLPLYGKYDNSLETAITQLVEFLENKLVKSSNDEFQMKFEEIIKDKLQLTGDYASDFDKISSQMRETMELINHLKGMQDKNQCNVFNKLLETLNARFQTHKIESRTEGIYHFLTLALSTKEENLGIKVFAAYDTSRKNLLYYGIRAIDESDKDTRKRVYELIKKKMTELKDFIDGSKWICYKETSMADLEQNMLKLIADIQLTIC